MDYRNMALEIKHIDVPEECQSTNDWDSHRPLLYLALTKTKGPIMEFGCGNGSTPLLKSYPPFHSFETNPEWALKFPETVLVADYMAIEPKEKISLLFVDCAPGEIRKHLIAKWNNHADVIVAHDTEVGANYVYGMADILNSFKYRLDYAPEGKPHTTAVSNFINVEEWL
jgi:hypothetical protein